MRFEKGLGYTNTVKNLVYCVSDGDVEHLYRLIYAALTPKTSFRNPQSKGICFCVAYRNFKKEHAMHAYAELVTELNLPLSCIENRVMRRNVVHKPTLCQVLQGASISTY